MEEYGKNIIPHIEAIYESFTPLEKMIADFFIKREEETDLSSKSVSSHLFVSEASLSRFAKKCGYKGYREFIFRYKEGIEGEERFGAEKWAKNTLGTYQELLNKSYALLSESQVGRIVAMFASKPRVYVYGRGSSGLAAMEMKLRFMRLGLNIEAITDSDIMKMNSVLLDEQCVVVGITVSGKTQSVIRSVKAAKRCGAATILMTSRKNHEFESFCDEIFLIAVKENLERGKAISPQFPILLMIDALYSRFLQIDKLHKEVMHDYTMDALDDKM